MIKFSCGCSFEQNEKGLPIFNPNIDALPLDCEKTWDMICEGNTKGVFQLESQLGQSKSREVKPKNIEELSDLNAIIRPGCISKDTKVLVKTYMHTDGGIRYVRKTIEQLFINPPKTLISIDENNNFVENELVKVFPTGKKECFSVKVSKYSKSRRNIEPQVNRIEASSEHQFLRSDGEWIELQYLEHEDRIAIRKSRKATRHGKNPKGSKYFQERCYQTHEEKCVMCEWNKCTLDVHHIEGNRNTNNDTENLVYLCPNCHRKHHSGMIASDELILNRENYKLSQSENIEWVTFLGVDSVGEKETYDLEMKSPYNNYIANDFIVHNCGDAMVKGKSLTNHYIDRKSGKDAVEYQFEVLEPILKSTYGILVYQEQAMQIAQLVAGFSLGQADNLRKAIGKKNVELMAKVKKEFIEGSQELKMINKEEAEEIFSWIEKSQKYSFNKSHSVSYAINGYQTAYCKAHFPRAFFTSYLRHAKGKPKPLLEVNDLVSNARAMDIDVMPPNIMQMKKDFCLIDNVPTFGITNIKNVGESVFDQLEGYIKDSKIDIYGMSWEEFLMRLGRFIKSNSFESMIEAGAFDCYKMQRSKMIYQFNIYKEIKDRDKTFLSNDTSKTFIKGIEKCIDDIVKNRRRNAWTDKNIDFLRSCIISLKEPPYELVDRPSWRAKKERDLMGIELTCSEVDEYDTMDANCTCREYLRGFDSNSIAIAAQVEDIREWKTKNGKHKGSVMAFLRLSDGTCTLDSTTIFSDDWKRMKETVSIGRVLLFRGTKDEKFGSFIIKKVQKLKQCI